MAVVVVVALVAECRSGDGFLRGIFDPNTSHKYFTNTLIFIPSAHDAALQIIELEAEVAAVREALATQRSDAEAALARVSAAEAAEADLKVALEAEQAAHEATQADNAALEKRAVAAETGVAEAEAAGAALEATISQLTAERDALARDNAEAATTEAERRRKADEQAFELQQSVAKLTDLLENERQRGTELDRKVRAAGNACCELVRLRWHFGRCWEEKGGRRERGGGVAQVATGLKPCPSSPWETPWRQASEAAAREAEWRTRNEESARSWGDELAGLQRERDDVTARLHTAEAQVERLQVPAAGTRGGVLILSAADGLEDLCLLCCLVLIRHRILFSVRPPRPRWKSFALSLHR